MYFNMEHCCNQMNQRLTLECEEYNNGFQCPDVLVNYIPKFDEYGLIIHDGGSSFIEISFCPWCGSKLPESKRDSWFDELEKLSFDNPSEQDIPEEFLSSKWFKSGKYT